MGKRHRRGGRTTPKGTRPNHLRTVAGPPSPGPPVDAIIDGGGRDLLDEGGAVAAEAWASQLLGLFDSIRLDALLTGQDVPPFEEALLERCGQRRDESALVVATAFAAVVPPPLDQPAAAVAAALARVTQGPAWLAAVGRSTPSRAWVVGDLFGDQDAVIVSFALPGSGPGPEHALVVLVDHNLSGQAKDAWLGDDADDVVAAWRSSGDPHMRVEEEPVDAALARLADAMAASDLWNGDTDLRSEDFVHHRALVWARLRRAGHHGGRPDGDLTVAEGDRRALVAAFLASPHGTAARSELPGGDVEMLAHHLVDLRSDYEGRPLRWSPIVVSHLLTDLAPRKLLLEPDEATALPAVLRAFVRFAGERTGLAPTLVDEVLAAVDASEPAFRDRIGDPSAAGPAKAVLTALQARGVALDDPDAVAAALDGLGPFELPALPPRPKARRKPADAPPDVVATAEASPVLARFDALVGYYGDGRKLTQTGQPTLADARALVALVGTDDVMDPKIGDRVFRTTSAAELPELGYTIRWAVAAGALRKEHGKLKATATWRKLDGKPVHRWLKAVDALPALGPLAAFRPGARDGFRQMADLVDEIAPDLLRSLPMPFDAALDVICDEADETFVWESGYWADPEARRRSFRHDLDTLVRILEWAGVAERVGTTWEPDRWDPNRRLPVGGALQLTACGQWWLGRESY